jgi:N-acetylneuraminate synthase
MLKLKEKFPSALIGLSDHTINNNASLAAIALGANIIERHFTDSKHRIGPDIINSMDPIELQELIKSSKEIFLMLGGEKEPALEEKVTMDFAFSTVVAIKDIYKADQLTMNNIWVKRPGTGEIKARDFASLLGKKTKRFVNSGQHLKWEDIE